MADDLLSQPLQEAKLFNYSSYGQNTGLDFGNSIYQPDINSNTLCHFDNQTLINMNTKNSNIITNGKMAASNSNCFQMIRISNQQQELQNLGPHGTYFNRNRYAPYHNRQYTYGNGLSHNLHQNSTIPVYNPSINTYDRNELPLTDTNTITMLQQTTNFTCEQNSCEQLVTLQINNLDYTLEENALRHFLLNQLKTITPVISLVFESNSYAKVTVPDLYFAKQVVSNLHRKKIGHKRMVVSYTRDSSQTEINTLRCQVAGLLKDVPQCTLPMYKFRELFQSRFKTSISVLDLYKMHDICTITADQNEEKYITLQPELVKSIENSPLMECLQHSVPYCTLHFKKEQHKGWAEQEMEPLPSVLMTITEIQSIIYPLLKSHPGDIPVASLVHCIHGQLSNQIIPNENGVNLEHLICCVNGIQITKNNFGIKILCWLEPENAIAKENNDGRLFLKSGASSDPLYQISREVIELIKMCPKATMKFNRFIPAYHNHFGKQCRVADYGYTKLIELFEALSSVVQIMGAGENRQITLTHRTQIRRFTSDLLRVLKTQGNKSILLSQLPQIFSQAQSKRFEVTDYGVCGISDILDGLVNSNTIVLSATQNGNDILISIPKRKQTQTEIEKTCVFAGEVVELFRNAPQYSVLFQKFVRSYHYHFGYQCRLSDYGFLKLADLMEAIQGIVKIEFTNDEDKRIHLSSNVARRIFAEQLEEIVRGYTGVSTTTILLDEVLQLHKKKFGYQIQPLTLGVDHLLNAIKILPYIELLQVDSHFWIICHLEDTKFRANCLRACKLLQDYSQEPMLMFDLIKTFAIKYKESLTENIIKAMKHAIQIKDENGEKYVELTNLMKFIIKIVLFIDQRHILLTELKTAMNLGISDCFQYGYPNLYSLLRAYPDIFVVKVRTTTERSEISLLPNGNLTPHISQDSSVIKVDKKQNRQQYSYTIRQPLAPYNKKQNTIRDSKYNIISQDVNNKKPLATVDYIATNNFHQDKENIFNGICNNSLNSSTMSDPNSSYESVGYCSGLGLLERRNLSLIQDNVNIFDLTNTVPIYPCFGPPKPDTPPSEIIPFWIDPVWVNVNGVEPPKKGSLNIRLPELKAFNILSNLMSPYSLSKYENMKQVFSFENTDRKIS